MNVILYDIMNSLLNKDYVNQRTLAEDTGYSLGAVNQALNKLQAEDYVDEKYQPTEKAIKTQKENSPENAIILAAGFGMRMVPINREVPKGLLEIHGEPLIERQIRQLHEAGIRDITVVVGFMKESYEYLIDKFGVKLLVNRLYAEKNNLHSLALATEKIGNTYIVPCDIWCDVNPFAKKELYSWYMVTDMVDDESDVRVNRKLELVSIEEEKSGNTMIGISYITRNDSIWLKERLITLDKRKSYAGSFWESALMEQGKMRVWAKVKSSLQFCEINTYEQLREMDQNSKNLDSDVLSLIGKILNCQPQDITEIEMLKKGMTNRSFFFAHEGKKYIMRIPGEGTDMLINRKQEHQVYEVIRELNLSDKICYFDPNNGYKLTEYLENTHCCDSENPEDVRKCMEVLRNFHQKEKSVDHTFDLFERIEFYENLWDGEPSCYRDYQETKKKVYELKTFIDQQPKHWALCHIDSVPDNFLMREKDGQTEIYLIDWEYAGMQDTDVDLAMFIIYAMYDKEQADELIDFYYKEGCPKERRLKIYAYVAVCGFLWSNWCEFKHHQGVEFGEYSLRQYHYAKEYYKYVKHESCQVWE